MEAAKKANAIAPSTGLPGLDHILGGLQLGDNIVWQVDDIEGYREFVKPFYQHVRRQGGKLIYFRFADHPILLPRNAQAEIHYIHPREGFEQFISEIHRVIRENGEGAYYVFDCFSELALDWYSDRMLGNLFMLTCPLLRELKTIAYFALLRYQHSFHATSPISQTAVISLEVYRHKRKLYVQPYKVSRRYTPTMYMMHAWEKDAFTPITNSADIAAVIHSSPWPGLRSASHRMGVWDRLYLNAEETWAAFQKGDIPKRKVDEIFNQALHIMITRDERMLQLARQYFNLPDILYIWKRMIGTGFIGGKAVGMLLARAILEKSAKKWRKLLEPHDSFYIGSEIFCTFLVLNNCWQVRQKHLDQNSFLEEAEDARRRMMKGDFPKYIISRFTDMLDYYGQSPIIVRSSSLLEDNFGNSFVGKYDSVFLPNRGPLEKRLVEFMDAIRTIYASCLSEEALTYRERRGLLDRDEYMALLVQRVSGSLSGDFFYPHVAGVGYSFNPFVWSEEIDPHAGMIRLVFGLGTRAVDRSDDDYTRVVALNAPERRPEKNFDEMCQYTQRKVALLDLNANELKTYDFAEVAQRNPDLPLELFATRRTRRDQSEGKADAFPWMLTFKKMLTETSYVKDMRKLLKTLQKAYGCPVDMEFTANFKNDGKHEINLVQCRPFQVIGGEAIADSPENIPAQDLIYEARGAVIGHSVFESIQRIIYVAPSTYGQLPVRDRYAIARLIGQLVHEEEKNGGGKVMLMGPGRWGTTTPSLGVPVNFGEINTISVLCEIVAMREDLIPDVSLGTHFFSEIVELDILYIAIFPHREDNTLNCELLESAPNKLTQLAPDAAKWQHIVHVIDAADLAQVGASSQDQAASAGPKLKIHLHANPLNQKAVCYLDRSKEKD
jgi:pyruvate,water dikinase